MKNRYRVEYTTCTMSGIVFGSHVTARDSEAAAKHILRTVPCAMLIKVEKV